MMIVIFSPGFLHCSRTYIYFQVFSTPTPTSERVLYPTHIYILLGCMTVPTNRHTITSLPTSLPALPHPTKARHPHLVLPPTWPHHALCPPCKKNRWQWQDGPDVWRLGCVRDCMKLLGGGVTASAATLQQHCCCFAAAVAWELCGGGVGAA